MDLSRSSVSKSGDNPLLFFKISRRQPEQDTMIQPVVDPSRYQGAVNTTVFFITKTTTSPEGVSSLLQSLKSPSYKDSTRYQGAVKARLSKTQGGYNFLLTPFLNVYQPFLIPSPAPDPFKVTPSTPCSKSSAFLLHWLTAESL